MTRTFRDAFDDVLRGRQRADARKARIRRLIALNCTILPAPSLREGEILVDPDTYRYIRQVLLGADVEDVEARSREPLSDEPRKPVNPGLMFGIPPDALAGDVP